MFSVVRLIELLVPGGHRFSVILSRGISPGLIRHRLGDTICSVLADYRSDWLTDQRTCSKLVSARGTADGGDRAAPVGNGKSNDRSLQVFLAGE